MENLLIILLEEKETKLIDKIPNLDRYEYDRLANLLDTLRRRSGVEVDSASYSVSRPQPVPGRPARQVPAQMHRVTYDLSVERTFYQLLRYVNLLENEKRFINVESFQVTPSGGSSSPDEPSVGAPSRGMTLRLYSFTYKPLKHPKPFILEGARKLGVSTLPPE